MVQRKTPSRTSIETIIGIMTGSEPVVSKLTESWSLKQEKCYIGSFCTHHDEPQILVGIDMALSASLAALLTRFMPNVAKEAIQQSQLPEELFLNLKEIMNILGSQLNDDISEHLLFKEIYEESNLPSNLSNILDVSPRGRDDYLIKIPNYFTGKISFLAYDA